MHKRIVVALLASLIVSLLLTLSASALSNTIVINRVQTESSLAAGHEVIELYNTNSDAVDISNWCVTYASASSVTSGNTLSCFTPGDATLSLFIAPQSSILLVSSQLSVAYPSMGYDGIFSLSMASTAGHIRVLNAEKQEIDKVGWGATATSPESLFVSPAPKGMILQRKQQNALPIDTNNNATDFESVLPPTTYTYGSLYEVQDVCVNITGIQTSVPVGFSIDQSGVCTPPPVDICENIDGLQTSVPNGYGIDENGQCQVDVCTNLTGTQATVPEFYIGSSNGICLMNVPTIRISEMLPNAKGDDSGNEFIELYNPNSEEVDLSNYRLHIGNDTAKVYAFPQGSSIAANGYVSFTNDDIAFTLVNSSSKVVIKTADDMIIDESAPYIDANDGESWALFDTSWAYTNRPTAGSLNLNMLDQVEEEVVGLKDCAPNQYRNPDTNRCRLFVIAGSTLVACKDGQYRSELTNRCRSIAADSGTLAPCASNQYRSEETNRCRLINADVAGVTACKTGQERNPDTNRCRNVASLSNVGYGVEPIQSGAPNYTGIWVLAGISSAAILYGIWEWRSEIRGAGSKLKSLIVGKK